MNKKFKILNYISFILIISLLCMVNVYADDYTDDIYDGDYSIRDMLRNYSVVTFGQKNYDSNATKLTGQPPGSLKIFHVTGNFIVKGNILVEPKESVTAANNPYSYSYTCYNGSNYSCLNNGIINGFGHLDHMSLDEGRLSYLDTIFSSYFMCRQEKVYGRYSQSMSSCLTKQGIYINIERLYNKIVEEQQKINKGKYISSNGQDIHIKVGGNYYIDSVNDIESIIFDNFENNENELTTITIMDDGAITFPKIFDAFGIIPTNDSFDSTRPNNSYPGNFVLSKYKGNIIWNVPNASYIKMSTTPFVGHLIAPKADVEGEEFHFAGAFLVNSLAVEDNTEAHFYPLKKEINYKTSVDNYTAKTNIDEKAGSILFNNNVIPTKLEEGMFVSFKINVEKDYSIINIRIEDEAGNSIRFNKVDDNEYEFEMPASNVTIIPELKAKEEAKTIEIAVPDTLASLGTGLIILIIVTIIGLVTYFYKRKESKKI